MKEILSSDTAQKTFMENFLKHPSFVPAKVPLMKLPAPFDTYIRILDVLHTVNTASKGGVRVFIENALSTVSLELIQIDSLSYWQKEKLLSVLTMLAHCYRWNHLPPSPHEYERKSIEFPEKLWAPLTYVADKLGHLYCGSHWSTTLLNFQVKGQEPATELALEHIKSEDIYIAHSWVSPELRPQLEQWIRIFVMTDIAGAVANRACIEILQGIEANSIPEVSKNLDLLYEGIGKIASVFNREVRGQKLDIAAWRNHIQPTFIWGIISDHSGVPLEGASGLQVGCIHLIDITLGLEMDSKMGKALMESRKYFPRHDRNFLQQMEPYRAHLKSFISEKNDPSLTEKYNKCVEALESYRVSHRQRGKVYIQGDGSPKAITTTGLSIQSSDDAIKHFEIDMNERIKETTERLL